VSLGVGAYVCVHDASLDTYRYATDWVGWVGEICGVIVDNETTYRVKQMGRMQRTAFSFTAAELHETVLTFEGPRCVTCGAKP